MLGWDGVCVNILCEHISCSLANDLLSGVARHPCLGMRFAKLEINLIVAFFLAYFDNIQLLDEHKKPKTRTWDVDRNRHGSYKPTETTYLGYRVRPE